MVYIETWDEEKPAGSRARSLGDDDIREFKRAIRERLAVDHEFAADESGNDAIGIHKQVTMKASADDPTAYDDVGYLYLKTVSGVIEFFYKDSDGNEIQISTGGKILGDNIQLTNNAYLKAKNAAGAGTVDLIKANASDKPVLPDGAQLATSRAPTADADISNKKYVDDQLATKAAIAAVNSRAAILMPGFASASSQQTAGSEADLDSMSVTLTTKGTRLLCLFRMDVRFGGSESYGNCILLVDNVAKDYSYFGSDSGTTQIGRDSTDKGGCVTSMMWLETGLTPGSHTVKIRWAGGGGYGVFGTERSLAVIDLD